MLKQLLLSSGMLFAAWAAASAEYIHNGSFLNIDYAPEVQRHLLQPYWHQEPNTYNAYKLVKDVEADSVRAHIKIQCQEKPKKGYDQLNLMSDLIAVPSQAAKVSFRARGNGKIAAYVFEYLLTPERQKFLRRAATLEHVTLSKEWKTFSFEYVPGQGELGKAMISFNFAPVSGDAVDIDFTDVSITAPEVQRNAMPARMVIPRFAQAPVIDGKVDAGEWKGALYLSGFKEIDNHAPAPNDSHIRLAYDDDYIYAGFTVESGDKPVSIAKERDGALYREDSMETIFSDINSEKFAQIIVSAQAVIYDANAPKANPRDWTINVSPASSVTDTGWSAELAIPRKELPFVIQEDKPFKLNFFQDDQIVSSDAERFICSVWAQCAAETSIPFNTANFPVAVLSGKSASASVETGSNGALTLHVTNPGEAQQIFCEYGTGKAHAGTIVVNAPQGVSSFPIDYVPQNELAVVAVRDAQGKELYRNAEIFKYRLETNLDLKKYLPKDYVELTSSITTLPEYRLAWSLGTYARGEFKVKAKDNPPMQIPIVAVPFDSKCPLTVKILDASGASMGERTFEIERPRREPWTDSTLGISDEPLPPFSAIKAEADSLEFLLTRYEYAGHALPQSVKSEQNEILAAPVTFKLNGTDLAENVSRKIVEAKPNLVRWEGENSVARWSGWAEEDGFAWYTVTVKAQPGKTAETLYLDIPVKKEFAAFLSPLPFFRSGGDMDGRYCYDFKPWVSMDFKQIVTLRNDDRGIELVAEDARGFSRQEVGGSHRLIPENDRVIIRMTVIDKPVKLDKERTYSFGIQAFPAKPFKLNPGSLASADYVDPRTAAWSGGGSKALVKLNIPGKISSGTIEFNAFWDFDPNAIHPDYHVHEYLRQTLFSFGSCGLTWNAAQGGFFLRVGKETMRQTGEVPVIAKGWHNIALTVEKGVAKLYLDKKLISEFKASALGGTFDSMALGKGNMMEHADFHFASVKVSRRVLAPDEFGSETSDGDTVLLQSFRTGAKADYRLDGELRKVQTDRGEFYSASGEYFTRLDFAQAVGTKYMLGYLGRIFQFYGDGPFGYQFLPYTNEEGFKAYGIMLNDLKRRGIECFFGFSFGYGINSREVRLYRDYYSIVPGRLYGNETLGFYCMCTGCLDYTNSFLYYINELMNRFDNLHIYTDNLFVCGRECRNFAHGCGYIDEAGQVQMSGNMLNGRRFAKRLYATTKLRHKPREHYLHSSGCNHAMFMSWADKYLCGEQYLENTNQRDWDIDLGQYRAQNVATCFGVPSVSISSFVPFKTRGMIAVAALHNCGTSGESHHDYPAVLNQYRNFLTVTNAFGIHDAEFLAYYKHPEILKTAQEKREFASCWKKPGKVLAVVSNLKWQDSQVKVKLDFAKLGVKGKVVNALTKEKIPVDANGGITLDIPAYDAVYLLVE